MTTLEIIFVVLDILMVPFCLLAVVKLMQEVGILEKPKP